MNFKRLTCNLMPFGIESLEYWQLTVILISQNKQIFSEKLATNRFSCSLQVGKFFGYCILVKLKNMNCHWYKINKALYMLSISLVKSNEEVCCCIIFCSFSFIVQFFFIQELLCTPESF